MKNILWLVCCSALIGVGNSAFAQWGDLKITFTLDGAPPKLPNLNFAKDPFCDAKGKADPHLIKDETYTVSSTGGLANVVVSLVAEKGAKVKIHDDYKKDEKAVVVLDNNKCRFEPRVAVLRTTQTLKVSNSDDVGHNSKIDLFAQPGVNPLIPAKGSVDLTFKAAERSPMPVSCNIHPWMKASLVIKEDPYVGVSDANGDLIIKNLPEGKHTFHVWHEGPGNVVAATVDGKAAEWKKGRVEIAIVSGKPTEMKVKLTPAQVTPKK